MFKLLIQSKEKDYTRKEEKRKLFEQLVKYNYWI